MSASNKYSIHCPKCEHDQEVELYDSINVAQEPMLKDLLLKNQLNRVECESCQMSFRVDKPVLYHDADRNILIHWMPDVACSRDEILDEFDDAMEKLRTTFPADMEPPRVRLVFTRVELVELMFMIEAGMDERVVEYVKYTIHTQNMSRVPPADKQLLLNVEDSTADELLFAVRNVETSELEDVLRYPRTAYRGVQKMYKENPDEFMELFPGPYISARTALVEEQTEESPDEADDEFAEDE
jgi:hypothetical protein